jgi:hypothetical protein
MLFVDSSAEIGGYQADHEEEDPVAERDVPRPDEDAALSSGVFLAASLDVTGG